MDNAQGDAQGNASSAFGLPVTLAGMLLAVAITFFVVGVFDTTTTIIAMSIMLVVQLVYLSIYLSMAYRTAVKKVG